ncbi:MAG: hypothetical protein KW804_02170 [Candidatus Doudnabacteria bacterium]|nr:hypothetical protein [Candidatus Doudnabacteria bacterium]
MALEDNERLQEAILLTQDKLSLVDRKWWYALVATIVLAIPIYYVAKNGFIQLSLSSYQAPKIIHESAVKEPLNVTGKGVFDLGNNNYSAYIKIKNIEYDWGVAGQKYTAEFKTSGGSSITKVDGVTFVLPAREKLIVFSKFHSDRQPEQMVVNLEPTNFIHKPQLDFNYEIERININNANTGLIVSAGIKNLTPFRIRKVDLPVAVYNGKNEVIAVNYTYINDLLSGETRTFQFFWPKPVAGAVRAEILPEVNIFDKDVFVVEGGGQSF